VQVGLQRWLADYVVAIVALMVVLIPLLRFDSSASRANRNVVLEWLGVLLWCVVLARLEWGPGARGRLIRFLQSGANALTLLFLIWAVFSAFCVAPPGAGRAFALNDLLRLGACLLVYLVVANHVETRAQTETLLDAILLIVGCATFYRIFIPQTLPGNASLIGSRLLAGGFLCLLLPVVAAVAAAPTHPRRQIAARVILVLTVVTLLVTPTRSSWIGALAGMALFGVLAVRHMTRGVRHLREHRHRVVYPVVALGGALALMLWMSDVTERAAARAQTLAVASRGEDMSLGWRLNHWSAAIRAVARRPLVGYGLGNWVLQQHAFTGTGQPREDVLRDGASMDEQAHNEYVQVAADLGLPGLALYLLILIAFFAKSAHALGRLRTGARKVLLIGCMSGIAAQCVDAVSNPAWRYSVCALYFWLVLGLGIALMRSAYHLPATRHAAINADVDVAA